LTMPERQGRDEFRLNFQTGKNGGAKIQMNFHVVILIETAANGLNFGDFAVHCDDDSPPGSSFELPAASTELDLRYTAVVILVEFGKLCRVPGRKRHYCLQPVCAWVDGETAQTGIMRRRFLKRQQRKQDRKNCASSSARPGQAR
jgi:hypothetical protein